MTQPTDNPLPNSPQVIKVNNCESLSGRSMITYHIGYTADPLTLYIRLYENSGNGIFNNHWVSLNSLLAPFKAANEDKPLGSSQLRFVGHSANTPGFLLAALKGEGVIKNSAKSKRYYVLADIESFMQDIQTRIEQIQQPQPKKAKGAA